MWDLAKEREPVKDLEDGLRKGWGRAFCIGEPLHRGRKGRERRATMRWLDVGMENENQLRKVNGSYF